MELIKFILQELLQMEYYAPTLIIQITLRMSRK